MKITVTTVFDKNLSKNYAYIRSRAGGVFKNPKVKKLQQQIAMQIQAEAPRHKWNKAAKLILEIAVYRPNRRWDAQNFVDAIADAVQMGTGVDDNKYTVHAIPELDKKDPRIEITARQ